MGIFDKIKRFAKASNGIDKQMLMEVLESLTHPESGKSFKNLRCIKDLEVDGGLVSLKLELSLANQGMKDALKDSVSRALEQFSGVKKLEIDVVSTSKPSVTQTTVNKQGLTPVVFKSLEGVKHIIAVASGKGGVGKSSTAVHLAFSLASKGKRVGILDADVYGPSVSMMTSAQRPTDMLDDLIIPPEVNGVKIIGADMFSEPGSAQMLRGPMVAQIVKQLLTQVNWGELDYLLIDYPPGTGDIQLTISQTVNVSSAIIVTTPQEVSLLDVRKAVSMFSTLKVPLLGVVETMSYFLCDGCDKQHKIFPGDGAEALQKQYDLAILAKIPMDPKLAESADKAKPVISFAPASPAASVFNALADEVIAAQASMDDALKRGLAHFKLEWKAD